MSPKEMALGLLKIAMAAYSPLADLVAKAIDNASEDERPLAEEVEEILPAESASARARRRLGGG